MLSGGKLLARIEFDRSVSFANGDELTIDYQLPESAMTPFSASDLRQLEELQRKRDNAQAAANELLPELERALTVNIPRCSTTWDGWPGTRPLARALVLSLTGVLPSDPELPAPVSHTTVPVRFFSEESLEQPDPEVPFR